MTTAEQALADRLGLTAGQLVRETGWDEDSDDRLRAAVEEWTGDALADEDTEGAADLVLLWWREQDGDLFDGLMDARGDLAPGGFIWLLTPRPGRHGHMDPADITESATSAALTAHPPLPLSPTWAGTRLEVRGGTAA
ncbi:DUF3052 domain-containing protein [Streptomyces seoulensis]|uniref:DUF3052 domain-containing protein n=1 Tax=Streptomyces seoulensis TaxID=73044 RepID=UPI003C2F8FE9